MKLQQMQHEASGTLCSAPAIPVFCTVLSEAHQEVQLQFTGGDQLFTLELGSRAFTGAGENLQLYHQCFMGILRGKKRVLVRFSLL